MSLHTSQARSATTLYTSSLLHLKAQVHWKVEPVGGLPFVPAQGTKPYPTYDAQGRGGDGWQLPSPVLLWFAASVPTSRRCERNDFF